MKELQGTDNLSCIELRPRLCELPAVHHVVHQVAAAQELHHEEEVLGGLEGGVETGEEPAVVAQAQHVALQHGDLHIVSVDDHLFFHSLDRTFCS